MNIDFAQLDQLKEYYNKTLNNDEKITSNDEPTPIECVCEMIDSIPDLFWSKKDISILDPCCGNGNFGLIILYKLLEHSYSIQEALDTLNFNDINQTRLGCVEKVFCKDKYNLNITACDFLQFDNEKKFDLVVANPPYAKILANGKRASKNHNLIKDFIEKSLELLKPGGFLLFITPDNWMSLSDRNKIIRVITKLQIHHLSIHTAKKYFKKIGSSFTWYLVEKKEFYKKIKVEGIWKGKLYTDYVSSGERSYIPLFYNSIVRSIMNKTIDNDKFERFNVLTSSDLHKYTKSSLLNTSQNSEFQYKIIHTPKQTVYSSRPHKYQDGWKVFIPLTDRFKIFAEKDCGMTQSIAFVLCESENEARDLVSTLQHPLYIFINNICRWGNFNNVRILQKLPKPDKFDTDIISFFNLTKEEIEYINAAPT